MRFASLALVLLAACTHDWEAYDVVAGAGGSGGEAPMLTMMQEDACEQFCAAHQTCGTAPADCPGSCARDIADCSDEDAEQVDSCSIAYQSELSGQKCNQSFFNDVCLINTPCF